ncbi:hypothetical protein NDU88_002984 [Pleurodeles waltl]|uniref:Uncharacterized protein n=1 Tax=Pleurodeles waltl TaxID=8319 RepID=A0AAV7NK65_PLEWA|nr:hypothetical protein NDU88_002984 [Pleurodeles waltl]
MWDAWSCGPPWGSWRLGRRTCAGVGRPPVPLEERRGGRLDLGPLPALLRRVNDPVGHKGDDWVPTPESLCHAEEWA